MHDLELKNKLSLKFWHLWRIAPRTTFFVILGVLWHYGPLVLVDWMCDELPDKEGD